MKFVNAMMVASIFSFSLSFVVIGQTKKPTDKPKYDTKLTSLLATFDIHNAITKPKK